jgi:hypothetical protein
MISPAVARTLLFEGKMTPDSVVVAGLRVIGRISIPEIPQGFHVKGPLDCSENPGLAHVGDNVRIDETLLLNGCPALKSIGNNLYVELDCDLSDCTALDSIGDGIYVGGELNLTGCSADLKLPENGTIGKDLVLPHDYSLDDLPDGLSVIGSTFIVEPDFQ